MQHAANMPAGVMLINTGHCELLGRLKKLREAIKRKVCRYTIENAIAFLEEYAEVQLCEEEQYMKYYGYSDFASHKEKHQQFITELQFLREELNNIRALGLKGSYELSVETVKIIADWITGHIADDDKRLGEFLMRQPDIDCVKVSSEC